MVRITTKEIKKTAIYCTLKQRDMIESKLIKKYNRALLNSNDGDYLLSYINSDEYIGAVIYIVTEDIEKHNKLVGKIKKWVIRSGDKVFTENKN